MVRRAANAFLEYGLGAVVVVRGDREPFYLRADDVVVRFPSLGAEPGITEAVAQAISSYDPEREAVVLREDPIGFTVSVERTECAEPVGLEPSSTAG